MCIYLLAYYLVTTNNNNSNIKISCCIHFFSRYTSWSVVPLLHYCEQFSTSMSTSQKMFLKLYDPLSCICLHFLSFYINLNIMVDFWCISDATIILTSM